MKFAFNFRTVITNSEKDLKERLPHLRHVVRKRERSRKDNDNDIDEDLTDGGDNCDDNTTFSSDNDDLKERSHDLTKVFKWEECEENKTVLTKELARKSIRPVNRKSSRAGTVILNMRKGSKQEYERACNVCDFRTTSPAKWKMHIRAHRPRGMCTVCGKWYTTDNLQKHIESHAVSPVPCEQCGKMYKNIQALRFHEMLHRGVRYHPCACDICGKHYKSSHSMKVHRKRHFGKYRYA